MLLKALCDFKNDFTSTIFMRIHITLAHRFLAKKKQARYALRAQQSVLKGGQFLIFILPLFYFTGVT